MLNVKAIINDSLMIGHIFSTTAIHDEWSIRLIQMTTKWGIQICFYRYRFLGEKQHWYDIATQYWQILWVAVLVSGKKTLDWCIPSSIYEPLGLQVSRTLSFLLILSSKFYDFIIRMTENTDMWNVQKIFEHEQKTCWNTGAIKAQGFLNYSK